MPWISQESQKKLKIGKMTPLTVKNDLQFSLVQGSLNPKITFLGEKL